MRIPTWRYVRKGFRMIINTVKLEIDAILPFYSHDTDAGADLYSYEDVTIYPGERHAVRTGISIDIPSGYVGLIHSRSGLASNKGLAVLNAPGTVDAGYHGEIKVILYNSDPYIPVDIKYGDRIAQLVLQKFKHMEFEVVDQFENKTERGSGGFGSTGR
jgi:dUTP pyrophosphatase